MTFYGICEAKIPHKIIAESFCNILMDLNWFQLHWFRSIFHGDRFDHKKTENRFGNPDHNWKSELPFQ